MQGAHVALPPVAAPLGGGAERAGCATPLLALAIGCLVFTTVYIAYCWFEREAARKREEEARDAEARAQREEARRTREKRRRAREEKARAHLEEGVNGARDEPPPIEIEPLTAFQMPLPLSMFE